MITVLRGQLQLWESVDMNNSQDRMFDKISIVERDKILKDYLLYFTDHIKQLITETEGKSLHFAYKYTYSTLNRCERMIEAKLLNKSTENI